MALQSIIADLGKRSEGRKEWREKSRKEMIKKKDREMREKGKTEKEGVDSKKRRGGELERNYRRERRED